MPTLQQVEAPLSLIQTKAPVVMSETHEEKRVMALFERIANLSDRDGWTWSASRGLKLPHGVVRELLRPRPLSVTRAEDIASLRQGAAERPISAD